MNNGWSTFLRRVFSLTLPIVLQNFINMAVSSADVIMLTYVGQNALSAAYLAGEVQFVLSVVFFGLNSGASVLAAQYWGKGDKTTVEKVLGMAVRYSMVIAVVFALVTFCFPAFLMGLFTNETALIEEGAKYLRIVSISYLFSGFSMMYLMVMRSVERVKLSTGIYTVSLVVNVLLNTLFIFGLFGLPKLGIVGVATATTLARLTEFAICAVDSRRNPIIRFRLKYAIKAANPLLQKDFWKYTLPSMSNELIWSLGITMFSVIIGHLGSDLVAAYSITKVARNLGSVICFGISSACAIMVGKELGAGRLAGVERMTRRLLLVTAVTAVFGGIVVIFARPIILQMGELTDQARTYLGIMLWVVSYYILGQALNTTWICGIFRPGGDATFGVILDILVLWVVTIPLTAVCAFVIKLPVMVVYFIICLDEFIKMPFVVIRYHKKKWIRNITRDLADE